MPESPQSEWTQSSESAANTALTLTQPAAADQRHYVTGIEAVVTAAVVGTGDVGVELRSGATRKYKWFIGAAAARGTRVFAQFERPIELAKGAAANLVVDAGGAAVVMSASMTGYTR